MNGLQYGVDPLLSLWLGQDSLVGEDQMGDLPPGVSPLARPPILGPQGVSGPTRLTNDPVGSRLGLGGETSLTDEPVGAALGRWLGKNFKLHDRAPEGRGQLPGQPEPPRVLVPDLLRPQAGPGATSPALDLTPREWDSPMTRTIPADPAMQDKTTLPSPTPTAEAPPASPVATTSGQQIDPTTAAILQLLREDSSGSGGKASGRGGVSAGSPASVGADPEFAGNMRQRLADYEQSNQPLTVPQQTPFDRSGIDKWLELAAPKEPAKRTWQDMLMDIGIGMTIGGAQGGKGWGALGPILAGGAKSFAEGRAQDRQDRREYEQAQRQYAGQRAGVESDLEGQRVRRSDELMRLQLDVDRANKGDKLAQLKVGMEVDRAIEESRRGNSSLALQKMQILSSNALGQARLRLAEQSNKIRLLGALGRLQGGGIKGPTIDVGGVKLPISGMDDAQVVASALPNMLNKGTISSFLPANVVEQARTVAMQQLGKPPKGVMPMVPGSASYDKRVNELMLPMLQAWLTSNDPEAVKRRASIASIMRAQPNIMALAGDRNSYKRGSSLGLLDDEEDF